MCQVGRHTDLWSKRHIQNLHPVSFANAHHDVTDLVNYGMVKNTITGMSWKQNLTFLLNKKILISVSDNTF